MTFLSVALAWAAVSMVVSPLVGGWLGRRPAPLASVGMGDDFRAPIRHSTRQLTTAGAHHRT
jgi:hypothetical protein